MATSRCSPATRATADLPALINEELDATIGQWQTFTVNFATPVPVRAITFQDYNDTTRDMNGPENWFIDNMSVTYNVPEPASLGLLGLGVPALLLRRRSKVKNRLVRFCQHCFAAQHGDTMPRDFFPVAFFALWRRLESITERIKQRAQMPLVVAPSPR